ncbi:MAG: DNA polymerase III subunit delta [Oscillospiraceae bacterium]
MPIISDSDLVKEIKSGKIQNAYYFYGKDTMSIENYTKALVKKVIGDADETYNLHRFSNENFSVSDFSDCIEALPVFAEKLCVVVNDLSGETLLADDLDFLIKTIKNIPETTVVIFNTTGLDVTGASRYITTKNKKIIDAVAKVGAACDFSFKKPSELVKLITNKVTKNGASISRPNAELLANTCLCNMVLITNEIEKLTAYVNGGEVTAETIDKLVTKQLDSKTFDLANAVTRFDIKKSLELLDELFSQRIETILIVAALSMCFVDLYRAKSAINARENSASVAADFGYKSNRTFAINNAFRDVHSVSIKHLRFCIKTLADVDIALKSTKIDERILIEQAITKMSMHKI